MYRFWAASKELNQTVPRFMTQELDWNQCIHGHQQTFFQGEATSKFCLSFSGCWRWNANGPSQNALPFLPHYSVLIESQFSIFCLKCFLHFGYQKRFSFYKLPNSHFFEHFLRISHNLRIINGQNSMSAGKTGKLDTLAKLFQAMRNRTTCWQEYRTTY